MPPTDPRRSPNDFESGMPGTAARTRAEAAIESLRQRGGVFVDAVRATRMAMVLTDPTLPGNPIVFANQSFIELSGYDMDEVLGQQPHFMNGPDTDPDDAGCFLDALAEDRDIVVETVQYRKDGSRFVATVLLSAFKDADGQTLHHFLSWSDVTRRVTAEDEAAALRKAQAALREGEAKYRGLIDSIDEGFCIIEVLFDEAGTPVDYVFLETNPAFERQTGLADAVGQRMRALAPDHEAHWFERYGRIVRTGQPERFEDVAAALGRWYDVYAFRVGQPGDRRVAILFQDVLPRKEAEQALQASEERQAFLLELSDALRPLAGAAEVQAVTARLLGAHLRVDRAMYAEVEGEFGAETGTIRGQYVRPTVTPFPERFAYQSFGTDIMPGRYSGANLVVADVDADPGFGADERAAWAGVGVRAAIVAPLVKGGRLVAEFGVHSTTPRAWSEAEVSLVRDVAERTWAAAERARVEEALRRGEERLRLIVENAEDYAIFTTDPDGHVIDWRDGAEAVFGYSSAEMTGQNCDRLFTPEDRANGQPERERSTAAANGKAADVRWHLRKDGSRVFIDGVSTALRDRNGALVGFLKIGQDVTERQHVDQRQKLLLAELQHRVRNILAMIRSVARRTGDTVDTVDDYARHFDGRIGALARTQVLLTRDVGVAVDLQNLILDELAMQAAQPGQYTIAGPDVPLPSKAAEVLGLAIHELATNAVKYGALSAADGRIDVRWTLADRDGVPHVRLTWAEVGVRLYGKPRRRGFGTELVTRRVPYELGGTGTMEFSVTGLVATIEFPLVAAASLLQTDEG